MNPKSATLFHFTSRLDYIKCILRDGFWPRYCMEDVAWQASHAYDVMHAAYPMVCFCEIPLSRIAEHLAFYGSYGVGVTRTWAVKNQLNPVMYVASDEFAKTFGRVDSFACHLPGNTFQDFKEQLLYLQSFIKPVSGNMMRDQQCVDRDFFQENEWRAVPRNAAIASHLLEQDYFDAPKLDAANALTKEHCTLPLGADDIRYLFVAYETEVLDLARFISNELTTYSRDDRATLISRILPLETVQRDW